MSERTQNNLITITFWWISKNSISKSTHNELEFEHLILSMRIGGEIEYASDVLRRAILLSLLNPLNKRKNNPALVSYFEF